MSDKLNTAITKDHVFRMSLSGFISSASVIALLWLFAEPVIVKSVSVAMAGNITEAVQHQVKPINNAFVALLQRDINKVRKDIAALKFRQRRGEDWTSDDALYLADLEIELESLRLAMTALVSEQGHDHEIG